MSSGIDPTTNRTFYSDAGRRKSGASSNSNPGISDTTLHGPAYQQGISLNRIIGERSMLPVLGCQKYRTIVTYKVADGTSSNRTIFAVEDFQDNPYFLDTAALTKSKYTSNIVNIEPTTANITGFILPDGNKLSDDSGTVKALFFDTIKPLLDAQGFVDYSGEIPIPADYQTNFRGYEYTFLLTSEKQTLQVTFPDGEIKQVPDMRLQMYVFGDNQEFDPETPFTELQKFDAIEFVKNNAPLGMFPETSKSKSYSARNIYNGIIEPFSIRDRIYGKEIFATDDPQKPGTAWGEITDPIEFSYSAAETTKGAFAMHEDVATARQGEAFFEEIYVSETVYRPDAYSDRDPYDSVYVDEELENVLISMDTTLDEGNLSVRYIDMTVGFDGLAKDRFGSLVYRGLLR